MSVKQPKMYKIPYLQVLKLLLLYYYINYCAAINADYNAQV